MADVQQLLSLIIGTLKSIEGQSLVSNSSEVSNAVYWDVASAALCNLVSSQASSVEGCNLASG